jgi:hypothetical protein
MSDDLEQRVARLEAHFDVMNTKLGQITEGLQRRLAEVEGKVPSAAPFEAQVEGDTVRYEPTITEMPDTDFPDKGIKV